MRKVLALAASISVWGSAATAASYMILSADKDATSAVDVGSIVKIGGHAKAWSINEFAIARNDLGIGKYNRVMTYVDYDCPSREMKILNGTFYQGGIPSIR